MNAIFIRYIIYFIHCHNVSKCDVIIYKDLSKYIIIRTRQYIYASHKFNQFASITGYCHDHVWFTS